MSTKEQIITLASDAQKAKVLSGQMLIAIRQGSNPTIVIGKKRITLVRTAQKVKAAG